MSDPIRLLLVDDDLVDRLTTRRLLKRARLTVTTEEVETGGAALNALAGNRFDCAILDHYLPGQDGAEVIATARERGVTTPILVLTGRGDDNLAVTVMQAGANDYLIKDNLDATRLGTSIEALVSRHRQDRHGQIQAATIEALSASMSTSDGESFLADVGQQLAEACSCDLMLTMQLTGDSTAKSVSAWRDGVALPAFDLPLAHPLWRQCLQSARPQAIDIPPQDHRRLLPLTVATERMVSARLHGANGDVLGLALVINPDPTVDTALICDLVGTYALRAGGEIDRRSADQQRDQVVAALRSGLRAAGHLVSAPMSTHEPLSEALDSIVHGVGACRGSWFTLERDGGGTPRAQRRTWIDHRHRQPPSLTTSAPAISSASIQRWVHRFQTGEWIAALARSLPAQEQVPLATEGVISVCALPVFAGVDLVGFIRLDDMQDERTWSHEAVEALTEFTTVLGRWLENQSALADRR